MNGQSVKTYLLYLLLTLLPTTVMAASFFPDSDLDINLTDDTIFQFDDYTISSGISVSYTAATNSLIDIVITNNMLIDGTLSFSGDATYSLTFETGTITETGSININSSTINLNGGTLTILSGTGSPHSGTGSTGSSGTLSNGGSNIIDNTVNLTTQTITITGGNGGGIILIDPTGPISGTGTLTINPIPPITGGTLTLTPVPLPPSFILFLTGLMTILSGFKRHYKKPALTAP